MNTIIVKCQCGTPNKIPLTKQHLQAKCGKCKNPLDISASVQPVELSDSDFQTFINQAKLPVLVDFYSLTCGPCKMLAPVIDKLAKKYHRRAIIAKINTSSNMLTSQHFQIRGVPTLIFFKNGAQQNILVGAAPEHEISQKLESLL
ncbi:MAG: thioredoxin [Proteobacteria bacterium]|nr:thioredoxin [Pseudomonadota bacterium]MBU1711121.1 thioredoxin [Pseudomonadota bacterium]